ncbi:MAG: hypothetical protein J6T10_14855 [Methanobrevibacter sp.]|nr:hypothetical protein [Methanobrevibacter sp.]
MKKFGRTLGLILIGLFALCVALLANGAIWWGIGNLVVYTFGLTYSWSYIQGFCVGIISFLLSPISLKLTFPNISLKGEPKEEQEQNKQSIVEELKQANTEQETNIE